MGTAASNSYNFFKRMCGRYNATFRALKAIEKEKLPPAPTHFSVQLDKREILENNPQLKKEFEALKLKDEQLDEHLKKVYLTSTSKNPSFVSKKPLPMKFVKEKNNMIDFKCSPGCCTYQEIIEMMVLFKEDPDKWSPTNLADKFHMDKSTIVNILMYYSLFKKEDFEFMNAAPEQDQEKVEFEVFNQLEKKPLKLIEGKKSQ